MIFNQGWGWAGPRKDHVAPATAKMNAKGSGIIRIGTAIMNFKLRVMRIGTTLMTLRDQGFLRIGATIMDAKGSGS